MEDKDRKIRKLWLYCSPILLIIQFFLSPIILQALTPPVASMPLFTFISALIGWIALYHCAYEMHGRKFLTYALIVGAGGHLTFLRHLYYYLSPQFATPSVISAIVLYNLIFIFNFTLLILLWQTNKRLRPWTKRKLAPLPPPISSPNSPAHSPAIKD